MCATSFSVTNLPTLYSFVISEKSDNKLIDRESGRSSKWAIFILNGLQNGTIVKMGGPPNGTKVKIGYSKVGGPQMDRSSKWAIFKVNGHQNGTIVKIGGPPNGTKIKIGYLKVGSPQIDRSS